MRRRGRSLLMLAGSLARRAPEPVAGAESLEPFDAFARVDLWWRQPKWSRREWRLEADGRIVAAMRGEPVFGDTSHVRFADAAFDLRRGWTGNIEARAAGSPERIARYASRWTGAGRVELPGEETLEFVPIGFLHRAHELRTRDGHVLVRLESHASIARHEVQVLLEDPARGRGDLKLLLALVMADVYAPKRHSSGG